MTDEYNGWSNRETWAVKLHWDNNEGDYRYFSGRASDFKEADKKLIEFADFLKAQAEDIYKAVEDGTATKEAKLFVSDVGSLWRVNWLEIAEDYYDGVEE